MIFFAALKASSLQSPTAKLLKVMCGCRFVVCVFALAVSRRLSAALKWLEGVTLEEATKLTFSASVNSLCKNFSKALV